jgi:hypothetical protein
MSDRRGVPSSAPAAGGASAAPAATPPPAPVATSGFLMSSHCRAWVWRTGEEVADIRRRAQTHAKKRIATMQKQANLEAANAATAAASAATLAASAAAAASSAPADGAMLDSAPVDAGAASAVPPATKKKDKKDTAALEALTLDEERQLRVRTTCEARRCDAAIACRSRVRHCRLTTRALTRICHCRSCALTCTLRALVCSYTTYRSSARCATFCVCRRTCGYATHGGARISLCTVSGSNHVCDLTRCCCE